MSGKIFVGKRGVMNVARQKSWVLLDRADAVEHLNFWDAKRPENV
jgi:hypothetical protein